jgi:hypothetical protein
MRCFYFCISYFTSITNGSLEETALNDESRHLDEVDYMLDKWNQDANIELNTING